MGSEMCIRDRWQAWRQLQAGVLRPHLPRKTWYARLPRMAMPQGRDRAMPLSVSLERRSQGTGPFLHLLIATLPAGDTPGTQHTSLHGLLGVHLPCRRQLCVGGTAGLPCCSQSESQALVLLRTMGRADLSAMESGGRESGSRMGNPCWGGAQIPLILCMRPPLHPRGPEGFRDTRPRPRLRLPPHPSSWWVPTLRHLGTGVGGVGKRDLMRGESTICSGEACDMLP